MLPTATMLPTRYLAFRRVTECGAILLALPIIVPICGVIALAIKIETSGPAIFRQRRPGLGDSVFTALKFRTMYIDLCSDGLELTTHRDRRVTRLGRFLRASHLDELPQLWNVLRGEMSLIGPRPEPLPFVERVQQAIPNYHERRVIPPGITGWAQINLGYTDDIDGARRKLELDKYYIKHLSLKLDATIVLQTVITVLSGRGAR